MGKIPPPLKRSAPRTGCHYSVQVRCSGYSRLADSEKGAMDDLAAAAAVVAMTIDDDGEEDLGLEDTLGCCCG